MEVESEDEEDEREAQRHDGHPTQPDQDTQVQDMDEVGRRHSNTTQFLENMVYNAFLDFTRDLMRKRME